MVTLSGRQLSLTLLLSFMCGVVAGYKLKALKIHYLKRRRDRLAAKLDQAQQKLEGEIISRTRY